MMSIHMALGDSPTVMTKANAMSSPAILGGPIRSAAVTESQAIW